MQGAKLWSWHPESALSIRGNMDMVRLLSTCSSHLQARGKLASVGMASLHVGQRQRSAYTGCLKADLAAPPRLQGRTCCKCRMQQE